jgi:hypothetical protein
LVGENFRSPWVRVSRHLFRVFSVVFSRVGNFLYRAGWVISGLLLFDIPPTIFAYSGFFRV